MAWQGGGGGEFTRKRRRLCDENNNLLSSDTVTCSSSSSSSSSSSTSTDKTFRFNDSVTADVNLRLCISDDDETNIWFEGEIVHLYLHSDVICRSQYFSVLLSDRWQTRSEEEEEESSSKSRVFNLTYKVPSSMESIHTHLTVIELLYSTDDKFSESIDTVSSALSIIHVALELMFEDCVKACIRLIEALPWTEEEEERVLDLIPLLKEEESQELLSRVSPLKSDSSHEMLCRLIQEFRVNHHLEGLVGEMLRDLNFSSKDSVRLALHQAFEMTLKVLKESLEDCSSERHTILETVQSYGDHLSWLVEKMVELGVADTALDRWIDQEDSWTENLQKVCSDKRVSPMLLINVILCTWTFADAVSTGSIVADRQVRMKLVKVWLPAMICFKDLVLPVRPKLHSHEFVEPFFKIISTLPMSESQELLQQCLGLITDNASDCPHLVSAYKTWFRRAATRPPKGN